MSAADLYRARAEQFSKMASEEQNRYLQTEYAGMAASYFRLAQLADKNEKTDLVYEAPATR
jgi:hypothetical protein